METLGQYLKRERTLRQINLQEIADATKINIRVLNKLEENDQVALRYVGKDGEANPPYPQNPNGSLRAIAGICDSSGRIFGLMPHPEAFVSRYQHPRWTREELPEEGDGLRIFRNAVAYFK